MKNIKCVLSISILVACFSVNVWGLTGSLVGCQNGNSHLKKVSIGGKVMLQQAFLPIIASEQEKIIDEAIEFQIKHLMGYFRTTHVNGVNIALSSYREKFEILKKISVKYGSDVIIDDYLLPARSLVGPNSSSYFKKALEVGKIKASDPALMIEYKTQLLIADCSEGDFQKLNQIVLPLDPFLSFWAEDKSHWQSRKFDSKELQQVSNCLASEIVSFGNAEQNWFFWSPIEAKWDSAGKKHDCVIKENSRVYQPTLNVKENLPTAEVVGSDFFKDVKQLKFYAAFGVISTNEYFEKIDFLKYKNFILDAVKKCSQSNLTAKCLSAWDMKPLQGAAGKMVEPGSFHFFLFLKYLHNIAEVKTTDILTTKNSNSEIQLRLKGRLRDSKTPIEISIYLGPTSLDYGPPVSKAYVNFLHQALAEADVISYLGHSGLGANLSMDNYIKLWRQYRLKIPQRSKPLWFGIYNCEGFSYFGFDQYKIFKPGTMDLITTSSSGVEAEAKFPLAQLFAVDRMMAGQKVLIKEIMGKYVQSQNFYAELRLKSNN